LTYGDRRGFWDSKKSQADAWGLQDKLEISDPNQAFINLEESTSTNNLSEIFLFKDILIILQQFITHDHPNCIF
jgi:hypothetical protein